jgi:hypothetical protein
MKTMLAVFVCINFAFARQIPLKTNSNIVESLEFQTALERWHEKIQQVSVQNDSLEEKEIKREIRKEFQNFLLGKTGQSVLAKQVQDSVLHNGLSADERKILKNNYIIQEPNDNQTKAIENQSTSTCHDIPFESKGNMIELSIVNNSSQDIENLEIVLADVPPWLKFTQTKIVLARLKAKEKQAVPFVFSVDKKAEVNKEKTVRFKILNKNEQISTKEIRLRITPPERYELFQNYPNPFNPATIISYQLPAISNVQIKIFDAIGREIENVLNKDQEMGFHQYKFDAGQLASGIYFVHFTASPKDGSKLYVKTLKMLLTK